MVRRGITGKAFVNSQENEDGEDGEKTQEQGSRKRVSLEVAPVASLRQSLIDWGRSGGGGVGSVGSG